MLIPFAPPFLPLPPTVTAVTAATGYTVGGNSVMITGTSFTTTSQVYFGSAAASAFTVIDDSHIVAVAPAESAATIDITVVNPAGTSATSSADHFTYKPGVTFDSAGPGGVASASSAVATASWTQTVPSGPNVGLLVGAHSTTANNWAAPTIKIGTTTLTPLNADFNYYVIGGTISLHANLYFILNPPSGSQSFTAATSNPGVGGYAVTIAANAIAYLNVSGIGSVTTASGDSSTAAQAFSSSLEQMVFNMMAYYDTTAGRTFPSYNQNSRWINTKGTAYPTLLGDAAGGAGSFSGGLSASDNWGSLSVPLLAA